MKVQWIQFNFDWIGCMLHGIGIWVGCQYFWSSCFFWESWWSPGFSGFHVSMSSSAGGLMCVNSLSHWEGRLDEFLSKKRMRVDWPDPPKRFVGNQVVHISRHPFLMRMLSPPHNTSRCTSRVRLAPLALTRPHLSRPHAFSGCCLTISMWPV